MASSHSEISQSTSSNREAILRFWWTTWKPWAWRFVIETPQTGGVIYVSLTDKGEKLFDGLYPGHIERILEGMEPLTAAECNDLTSMLNRLNPDGDSSTCVTPAEQRQENSVASHR